MAELDLTSESLAPTITEFVPTRILHLAAQAGVRRSLTHPAEFVEANLVGFFRVLEISRLLGVEHLAYASSSSVYGFDHGMPFSESRGGNHPVSFYGATKRANELMAHSYSEIYGLPVTGLRFFTVYGPWGRPDMSPILFARSIQEGKTIRLFNRGHMKRDFTFVDDIVEGIARVLDCPPTPDSTWEGDTPEQSRAPFRVFNIGRGAPTELFRFVSLLEEAIGKKAILELAPMPPGEVLETYADVSRLVEVTGFRPQTDLEQGINQFVKWFKDYYPAS